jgi:16S rRNA (adenine1518-N6/adenine1519-N6)-dimethyltransferase
MKTTPSLRERLRVYGITPRKSLGQNFLTDTTLAQRIVTLSGVTAQEVAIEIGPGAGALTHYLALAARHVIAIEIDRTLIPVLQQELATDTNVTLVQADALEVDFGALLREHLGDETVPLRFVGNLPYYITSALVRKMLEAGLNVRAITLTVQMEVAQRMIAQPGDMSLLAVSVQFYGKPELLMRLSPSAFYPQPEVDSAVVRITPHPTDADATTLFTLARAGFSQRRKQLRNTISSGLSWKKDEADHLLQEASIDPTRRAETLSMAEWIRLSEIIQRDGLNPHNAQ